MTLTLTRILPDEAATMALGRALASRLQPGLSVHFTGALGAGKTTLVRALLRALGERGRVRSPTFTLMEPYCAGGLDIVHLDLYRFEHPEELFESGFDELIGGSTVTLIEWPERAQPLLPLPDIAIAFEVLDSAAGEQGRQVTLTGHGARGEAVLGASADLLDAGAQPAHPAPQPGT